MIEQEYRAFRRRAIPAIARSVVRDPPVDRSEARVGDGPGTSSGSGEGEDGTGADRDVVVRLHPAVRSYLQAEFEDALGEFDPRDLATAVPVDPPDVDTSASSPLAADADGELDRGRLLAYRTVRADLLGELADHAAELAVAIEVHDALQRLVGERGPSTDRRPEEVVAGFLSWIADRRDEAVAEALRDEFTVLHVMRVAPLYTARDDGSHELAVALREWLRDAHPDALGDGSVTVER